MRVIEEGELPVLLPTQPPTHSPTPAPEANQIRDPTFGINTLRPLARDQRLFLRFVALRLTSFGPAWPDSLCATSADPPRRDPRLALARS